MNKGNRKPSRGTDFMIVERVAFISETFHKSAFYIHEMFRI